MRAVTVTMGYRASCSARQTFSAVAGISIGGAPAAASASLIAFITAGIAPIVPASPTPLTPSGLRSVGVAFSLQFEAAEIVGPRHRVILERAGQQLPALRVVDQVFHQHLAEPLDDAAMDLPLAQERVQHRPDIVDGAVAGQRHLAGLGVDLDLADMRAGRKRRGVLPARNSSAR